MKKIIKRVFLIGIIALICTFLFFGSYITIVYATADVKFEKTKITDSNLAVMLYDSEQRPLEHTFLNGDFISLKHLPKHTIDAFISIEDKEFYNHSGLNYKRMISAMAKNIMSFSFKEGASTISQQLIKNTHLTNEKTLKRKINEIKLTKKLESNFSKDEILEYYLNIIYFGDNCYGIQNASEHYFSHSASKLTLDESAMLAGIIKSPNKYHPISNYEESIKRRNLILSELKKDGKISELEYTSAKSVQTKIVPNYESLSMNAYAKSAIKEAENILKMPEKQIAIGNYRIYTYMNKEKQNSLENCYDKDLKYDLSMISLNAKNGGVEAYIEKSNLHLIDVKRQPASAIKPVLVYAPAINDNIISPSTIILDDKVSINGYSPQNIGGKHYGYVNSTFALSQSLNIPAVKVLSYVGIERAKNYLEMQNVEFDKEDTSLAIALGGMTYGMTLKELTNTYQTIANGGKFVKSSFIKYIVDKNGKVIYKNNEKAKNIYRDDTAYLLTTMLCETTKTGTAKRMSDLDFVIASKTGTSSVTKNNLDAYNISYTSEDVIGCWIGNVDHSPIDIVGGGAPTSYVKNYLLKIYDLHKPKKFTMPSSIIEKEIDLLAIKNEHCVYLANDFLPERYREPALFSRFNIPEESYPEELTITPPKIEGMVKNGVAEITFYANEYYIYELYKITNNKEELIETISNKAGKTSFLYALNTNQICSFGVKAKVKNFKTGEEIKSDISNVINLYNAYNR